MDFFSSFHEPSARPFGLFRVLFGMKKISPNPPLYQRRGKKMYFPAIPFLRDTGAYKMGFHASAQGNQKNDNS
jgi:hypothetical protein